MFDDTPRQSQGGRSLLVLLGTLLPLLLTLVVATPAAALGGASRTTSAPADEGREAVRAAAVTRWGPWPPSWWQGE